MIQHRWQVTQLTLFKRSTPQHSDDAYATFYEAQQNSFWSLYISFTGLILTLVKKHVIHMKNTKKDSKIRLTLEGKGSKT
jgi:hypothetical protein